MWKPKGHSYTSSIWSLNHHSWRLEAPNKGDRVDWGGEEIRGGARERRGSPTLPKSTQDLMRRRDLIRLLEDHHGPQPRWFPSWSWMAGPLRHWAALRVAIQMRTLGLREEKWFSQHHRAGVGEAEVGPCCLMLGSMLLTHHHIVSSLAVEDYWLFQVLHPGAFLGLHFSHQFPKLFQIWLSPQARPKCPFFHAQPSWVPRASAHPLLLPPWYFISAACKGILLGMQLGGHVQSPVPADVLKDRAIVHVFCSPSPQYTPPPRHYLAVDPQEIWILNKFWWSKVQHGD